MKSASGVGEAEQLLGQQVDAVALVAGGTQLREILRLDGREQAEFAQGETGDIAVASR
jgi:hypothetical protein